MENGSCVSEPIVIWDYSGIYNLFFKKVKRDVTHICFIFGA